jgi:adenosylhomocysteine nucleosidase
MILVCFAMPDEARPFRKRARSMPNVQVQLTGIGRRNAEKTVGAAMARQRPDLVLSSGFAGGLHPQLPQGALVFDAPPQIEPAFLSIQARRVRFYCADRIAATSSEKQSLRSVSGADAVEMESQAITNLCRGQGIPCATLRIILDTAERNLPMDFNKYADSNQKFQMWKLLLDLAFSPGKVGPLLYFQKECVGMAEKLSAALCEVIKILDSRRQ